MQNHAKATWLIKSSGKIFGPFSLNEVIDHLVQRRFSIIDEIKEPCSRWIFIRENKIFFEIVGKLKQTTKQKAPSEDGYLSSSENGSETLTETLTEEIGEPQIEKETIPIKPDLPTLEFGFAGDRNVQKKIEIKKNLFLIFSFLIFISLLFLYFYYNLHVKKHSQLVRTNKVLSQFDLYKKTKAWDQLLDIFLENEPILKDEKLRYDLIPVLILKNKISLADKYFKDFNREEYRNFKFEDRFLKGLFSLKRGEFKEAEQIFEELFQNKVALFDSGINYVLSLLHQNNLQKAWSTLEEIKNQHLKGPYSLPIITYLEGLIKIEIPEKEQKEFSLSLLVEDLEKNINESPLLQEEQIFLLASLKFRLGEKAEGEKKLKLLFNKFPEKMDHFGLGPYLYYSDDFFQWSYLTPKGKEIAVKYKEEETIQPLNSYLTYKNGNFFQSLELIDFLRKQYPINTQMMSWNSLLLHQVGRLPEAKALLLIPEVKKYPLSWAVEGMICDQETQWDCSENSWKTLASKDSMQMFSYFGWARSLFKKGKKDESLFVIRKGLSLAPDYVPLVLLMEEMNP